jgi:hypothetical protein
MSFDDASRGLSADQLFARIRALLGPSAGEGATPAVAPPASGASPLKTGLIGSGWARFMADRHPGRPQTGASSLDSVSWRTPTTLSGPASGVVAGPGGVSGAEAPGIGGEAPTVDPADNYQVAGPVAAKAFPNSLDPIIEAKVAAFNKMNQADPGDDVYLDPDWIRAMVRVESAFDPKAYRNDPMQVNKSTHDWDGYKSDLGLKRGVAPGQDLGIKAGIDWLESKAYHYNGRGDPTTFRGWDDATRGYNGGGNPHYLEDVKRAFQDIKAGR